MEITELNRSEQLKPCPFCESEMTVNEDAHDYRTGTANAARYGAKCRRCGASFWHPDAYPELNWNARPIESRLERERDAALRERDKAQEKFFNASKENGVLSRDLSSARAEIARLNARLDAAIRVVELYDPNNALLDAEAKGE